jgi:hypothetical protein
MFNTKVSDRSLADAAGRFVALAKLLNPVRRANFIKSINSLQSQIHPRNRESLLSASVTHAYEIKLSENNQQV